MGDPRTKKTLLTQIDAYKRLVSDLNEEIAALRRLDSANEEEFVKLKKRIRYLEEQVLTKGSELTGMCLAIECAIRAWK